MRASDIDAAAFAAKIPDRVAALAARLAAAGGRTWVVGGAVRDHLRNGATSGDWDLATDLPPQELLPLVPDAAADARLGAVHWPSAAGEVAVHVLRAEDRYQDRRRPSEVRFVRDPAVDAQRRDFTVNAIYFDLARAEWVDPCGGRADLAARKLRMIGDPQTRLAEDPLRLLRAIRFAASAELELDEALVEALAARAELARSLSAYRVFGELTRAFTGPGRGRALRLLVDTGLAAVVLPEVPPMDGVPQPPEYHPEGDVLTHVCLVLDHACPDDPVQAWAAVLHDVGKPPTFERAADRIRFSGHDTLSAEMADDVLRRLGAANELRETVVEVCRDHIRIASLPQMKPGKRERWLRDPRFLAHLEFHRADCEASHGDLRIYQAAAAMLRDLPPPPAEPLCRGRDVMALGLPAGPMVGKVLRELQSRLDAMEHPDRETALSILGTLVEKRIKTRSRDVDQPDSRPEGHVPERP
ncbi:MAG: HDIG domain-containing metalloprotein [Planctomycetota bacterium]